MLRQLTSGSAGKWLLLCVVLASFARPLAATAATAGELLEKAIYTEETVGDLSEAIELYEQVVAAGKAASHAAAQAQYRIGLCYEKLGKMDQATAAFQAVVDNFPNENDLVTEARKHLPGQAHLLPAPWVSGERLHLDMRTSTGLEIGTMIYMIDAVQHNGRDVWQCSTRGLVTVSGANSFSRVICDRDTFAPLQSTWRHSLLGDATATYDNGRVDVSIVGKPDTISLKIAKPAWDNEQGMEIFRRLPLQVGYKTKLNFMSSLGGQMVELTAEVPEKTTIEVPAGKFECFKLVLDIGQTFYVADDEHRYVTRFEAGSVVADLSRVEHQDPDAVGKVSGEGYSLSLPAGWQAYRPGDLSGGRFKKVYLLDPQGFAITEVTTGPQAELKADQQSSPRAWTESYVKEVQQRIKDFKVREPGVIETKVAGQTAAAIVADHQQTGQPLTVYGVALFANESAINLRMSLPTNRFEDLRADFDAIVSSLQLE